MQLRNTTRFKQCKGPAHSEAVVLPLTTQYWYFRKDGRPRSWCRMCRLAFGHTAHDYRNAVVHGYVPTVKVQPLIQELLHRCSNDAAELHKLTGIGKGVLHRWVKGEYSERVQQQTVVKVVVGLIEARKRDRRNGYQQAAFTEPLKLQAVREQRIFAQQEDYCG